MKNSRKKLLALTLALCLSFAIAAIVYAATTTYSFISSSVKFSNGTEKNYEIDDAPRGYPTVRVHSTTVSGKGTLFIDREEKGGFLWLSWVSQQQVEHTFTKSEYVDYVFKITDSTADTRYTLSAATTSGGYFYLNSAYLRIES